MVKLKIVARNNNSNLLGRLAWIHKCISREHGKNIPDCVCHLKGISRTIQRVVKSPHCDDHYEIKDGPHVKYLSRKEFWTQDQLKTLSRLQGNLGAKRLIELIKDFKTSRPFLIHSR
ncbi:hypothetical protein HY249_00700 [Candidatus Azambacteria bacterium]|nr:hypothetical protein [Candidatus Azambacteria bacterium]